MLNLNRVGLRARFLKEVSPLRPKDFDPFGGRAGLMDGRGDDGDFLLGVCFDPAFEEGEESDEAQGCKEEDCEAVGRSSEHCEERDTQMKADKGAN